jgi:hypothetical protein
MVRRSGRRVAVSITLGCLAACGGMSAPPTAGDHPDGPPAVRALGMNDITFLLPLPPDPSQPVLLGIAGDGPDHELVSRALFDQVAQGLTLNRPDYTMIQVVGVRFDVCNRDSSAACVPGADGELRLAMQPIGPISTTEREAGVHALYRVAAADVPTVVDQLRALAALAEIPTESPLMVNTAVTAVPGYRDQLRAFVTTYARSDRLARLAIFNVFGNIRSDDWEFTSADITGGSPGPLTFDGATAKGGIPMLFDDPRGMALASSSSSFRNASPAERTPVLELLAGLQNPGIFGFAQARCVACHFATVLEAQDLGIASVDPSTVRGRFVTRFNVSIAAGVATDPQLDSNHMLGYLDNQPIISQRVANETANVLDDIYGRFSSGSPP